MIQLCLTKGEVIQLLKRHNKSIKLMKQLVSIGNITVDNISLYRAYDRHDKRCVNYYASSLNNRPII